MAYFQTQKTLLQSGWQIWLKLILFLFICELDISCNKIQSLEKENCLFFDVNIN
jgi:hypothetical protein